MSLLQEVHDMLTARIHELRGLHDEFRTHLNEREDDDVGQFVSFKDRVGAIADTMADEAAHLADMLGMRDPDHAKRPAQPVPKVEAKEEQPKPTAETKK